MSDVQLGLDGTEVVHPVRRQRRLTDAQRQVIRFMRHHGDVRPVEIGRVMHVQRGRHAIGTSLIEGACCQYASSDGADALRRLADRGLVYRVRRGCWRLVTHQEGWT